MAFTAFPGSVVVFGAAPGLPGTTAQTDYNTTDGPSLFNAGAMIMDPRKVFTYSPGNNYGGSSVALPVYGWMAMGGDVVNVDAVPTAISTNSIAQAQSFTSSTPVTLTASVTNNITFVNFQPPEGGPVINIRAIDGAMGTVTFGSDASIAAWDPTKAISRCITITTTGTDTGGFWSVAGRDVYGVKITETIAASTTGAANTLVSKKAYKYITGVTPVTTGTFGSTVVYVGVSDTYGLGIYASNGAYVNINLNNVSISSTTVTPGMALNVIATSTTGDVRGTWASTTASNGTNRLITFVIPSVAAMNTNLSGDAGHGIVGALQFSSV